MDLNSYYPVFAILALGVLLVHFEKEIYFGGAIALVLAIIALALRRVAARGRRR